MQKLHTTVTITLVHLHEVYKIVQVFYCIDFLHLYNFNTRLYDYELSILVINIKRIDLDQPVVTSCMTGMSATIAAGVLHVLGKDAAVYYVSFFYSGRKLRV